MDFCKYVNVFQGSGEIDLPKPQGIAAKWFFLKAGCGNTTPAAMLPFSRMSVGPFSGGYPTGYGDHCMNSHSRPRHFEEGKMLRGFAHLQQSGTGAMGYYYNYAVVSPTYEEAPTPMLPENEQAQPGYYRTTLGNIQCELTVTERLALHRYTFGSDGGRLLIDFTNNGIRVPGAEIRCVTELKIRQTDEFTVAASALIEGINIFFAVRCTKKLSVSETSARTDMMKSGTVTLAVAISLVDENAALGCLDTNCDFDCARAAAYDKWNEILGRIAIETDDCEIREIFYSNLYHSLVKPSDRSGESFLYAKDKPFSIDLNTLWDMYKTAIPLIFMIDREQGEKISETILCLGEALGAIPNSIGASDEYLQKTEQARMLGDYVLLTAYRFGLIPDCERMLGVIENDLLAPNKLDFTRDGKCASHTWTLDMADACANAAVVARETGDDRRAELFERHAKKWKNAYSEETGLIGDDSIFYEGTAWNYSFRQMVSMDERIELAGGKERFTRLLDKFFGYGAPDVIQPTNPFDYEPVSEGTKLGRFEGYNNESDTEAPYSYIYAGRHDRTSEIVRAGMKYMFTTGRGGLPGNNDSGALSSLYCINALGLFPVAGQNAVLLGSPFVKSARVSLSSGKELSIKVNNGSDENIYVENVTLNGKKVAGFRITATELMNGGLLEFTMRGTI